MAVSTFSYIWKLISQHKFSYECDEDVTCLICKELMIDACQGVCGCQFCYKCIHDYIGNSRKYCPGNDKYCNDECLALDVNVFRNAMLNKRVSKLKVNCPNQTCGHSFELIEMEEHLRLCAKQPIECPFIAIGCISEESSKDVIEIHLQRDSLNHSNMLMELIKNMNNEFNGLKEDFNYLKLENLTLKEELLLLKNEMKGNQEIKKILDEQRREMERLTTMVNVEIKDDLEKRKLEMVSLKEESKSKDNIILELKEELKELRNEMREQRDEINKEINEGRREREDARIDGENVTMVMNDVRKEVNEMKEEMNKWDRGREGRKEELCANMDGGFEWRMERCSEKIGESLYSESFYRNNYKLCLYAMIIGDDIGLGFLIMKGDNDDKLPWPMRQTVTLSIVDQVTLGTHKSEVYKYDTYEYKKAFDRPNKDRNHYFIGSYSFIKYSSIRNNPSVIVNDSILIKCTVNSD